MTDTPEVSLLGGVAVRGRGTPATSRAIGLLAYLVLHAEAPQSRSHLAGMFWPDSSEAQARTNLRRELHHLRAILGDVGCLVTTGTTLAWRDVAGFGVDVRTFLRERETALEAGRRGDVAGMVTAATAAVDAYRGPFLPGWYDDWILEARNDLQRSCIDLCDRVVSEAAPPGSVQVLALARRRVQLSPLEEQGYQQLMRLQPRGAIEPVR